MTSQAVTIIADLHLGAGPTSRLDRFRADAQLAALLDRVAARAGDGAHARLVLLGDIVDFHTVELDGPRRDRARLDTSADAARRKLDLVAAGHPAVFEGLRRVLAAGVAVDLVPGNHDLELLRSPVATRLRELVGGPVRLLPWCLRIPGVLFAEHGSQQHDINRQPEILSGARGGALPLPPGVVAPDVRLQVADAPSRREAAAVLLSGSARGVGFAAAVARAARRRATYADIVREHGAEAGIAPEALVALEDASRRGPIAAVQRLGAVGVGRRRRPDGYMLAAATRAHAALDAAGQAVPFYVFGHTHRAADAPLGPRPDAPRYLNPGAWTATADPTFLRIVTSGDAPRAAVLRWAGGSELPLAAQDAV